MISRLTILMIIAALAISASALGQSAIHDSYRSHLERTDQVIDRARDAVHSSNDAGAGVALQAAIKLQEQAWRLYHEGVAGQRTKLVQCKAATMKAREWAQKSMASGRFTEQNANSLQHKLERARAKLDDARTRTTFTRDQNFASVLETAEGLLSRAWEFYREGRYRPALKLCNQVEQTVGKVLTSANQNGRRQGQFERGMEFVQKGFERARETLADCQSEVASSLMRQARQAYDRAQQLRGEEHYEMALQSLQNARKLAEQAVRECRGTESLGRRYERLTAATDRAAEDILPGDEQGSKLLKMTHEQLQLAKEYLQANNTAQATAALKAAELTMGQLRRHLGQGEI